MEEQKTISEILKEHLGIKGLNLSRLHQITGIPERFLEAFIKNEFHKMPAAPYVYGYIMKIAKILNLNSEELWQQYKNEIGISGIKSSGQEDRLPKNRFAIKSFNKKRLIIIAIIIAVIAYLILNFNRFIGQPTLIFETPTSEISIVNYPAVKLSGKINPSDILKINKEEISVDKEGNFSKIYNLQEGINNFEFSVKRFLGKELKINKQVIYQVEK